jgi:3-mercaptopyruvate sulfurtransferase SseA/class 3 adenylate cyclase
MSTPLAVFAHPEFLVESEWLAAHLGEPDLRVIDCTVHIRFDPVLVGPTRSSGREDFEQGHIPGAQFVDVVTELSDPTNPVPCMAPSATQFAAAMSRLGIGNASRVVLYSGQNAYWAARVWWLLRLFGFDNAAVLNGGWQKWRRESRPTEAGPARPRPPSRFVIRAQRGLVATKAEVLAAIGDPSVCTINALPADQHLFASGIHYGRPGHIAGSLNVPAENLLDPVSNEFLPADRLRQHFEKAGAFGKRVITYCGAGSAASADAMALMMLGHPDVRLYDGSLCEWAADPSLPMEAAPVPPSSDQAIAAIENSRLLVELHEALAREHAMAEVLKVINSSPGDLAPVFEAILEKATRLCEAAFGILKTYDGEQFRPVTLRGVPRSLEEFLLRNEAPQPTPESPSGRMISGEDIVQADDLAAFEGTRDSRGKAMVELGGAHSYVTVALRKDGRLLGTIAAYRQEVRPFNDKQVGLLRNFAAQAAIAMENARLLGELRQRNEEVAELNRGLEARVAEQVDELGRVGRLKRFLAPQLAELIVSQGDEKILESHRREIVVVFCDLRGYTAFTETAEPEEVLDFLREYHGALGPLVSQFEGTLDQFSGDGIMVFFNDPVPIPDPAERAVKMAMAMREEASTLIASWRRDGCELGFGVGIAQGYATLGQIGFSERSGYTAIGTVCNLSARLCAEAKDGQILISGRVARAVEAVAKLEDLGNLELKGLRRPVAAFNVVQGSSPAEAHPNLTVVARGPGA